MRKSLLCIFHSHSNIQNLAKVGGKREREVLNVIRSRNRNGYNGQVNVKRTKTKKKIINGNIVPNETTAHVPDARIHFSFIFVK